MTVSKQTLLNTLRTFKNLQESNGGSAQAVLDTVPATVDGGLWYDSDAPAIKLAHNGGEFMTSLANTTIQVIDNTIYIGDYQFQFTGLATALTFHDGKFYAASDTSYTTELGTVNATFSNNTLTACTFNFTALAALNVAVGNTVSVTQIAGQAVNLKLNLGDEIPTSSGSWTANYTNGYWRLHYETLQNAVYARRSSATAFQFVSSRVMSYPTYEEFYAEHIGEYESDDDCQNAYWDAQDYEWEMPGTVSLRFLSDNFVNQATSFLKADAPISITETFDDNDRAAEVVVTFKDDSVLTETYRKKSNLNYFATPSVNSQAHKYPFTARVEMEEGAAEIIDTATLEYSVDGIYTYKSPWKSAGYYTDDSGYLHYESQNIAKESFTISGLAPNLTVVYDADNDRYNIVKNYHENEILGTISKANQNRTFIVITSLDMIDTSVGRVILMTDVNPNDNTNYILSYIDDLAIRGPVMVESEVAGTYKYPVYFGNLKMIERNSQQGIYSCSYDPDPASSSDIVPITISGLKSGLGELTVTSSKITTASGTEIATISNDRISLTSAAAMPNGANNQPSGHTITLEFEDHTLYLALSNWGWFILDDEELSFTGSNGTYTVTATPYGGTCSGFAYTDDDDKTLRWFDLTGTGSFTVSGLKTLSGTLAALRNLQDGFLLKAGDTVIGDVRGNVVTLNAAALPDNPTSGTAIQFTANTFDYNFNLDSDVDARTFTNESITAETTAGTYIYSANGSTVGWQVTPDGDKIIFAPELNGTTKTLTGLRTDLGTLTFDERGRIHAQNGGIVGFMDGSQITWYAHALLTPSTSVTIE